MSEVLRLPHVAVQVHDASASGMCQCACCGRWLGCFYPPTARTCRHTRCLSTCQHVLGALLHLLHAVVLVAIDVEALHVKTCTIFGRPLFTSECSCVRTRQPRPTCLKSSGRLTSSKDSGLGELPRACKMIGKTARSASAQPHARVSASSSERSCCHAVSSSAACLASSSRGNQASCFLPLLT